MERATISRWENDKTDPSNEDLIKLAQYFKVSVDYLLGRTINPTAPDQESQNPEAQEFLHRLKSSSENNILSMFHETISTYGKLSKEEKERMLDGLELINQMYKKKIENK